ncbi:hypothetical protein [Nocardioides sp.]|uniref:hypothetical protein n=1 Tax=Nocardioides sp. TaxID=35761 RepID=UPI0031FF0A87|nr:hypothetical protein [Nocardioides sp.]
MPTADERDAIASIAERAWPAFRENGWKWRGKPITEARLALGIHSVVEHLRAHPKLESVSHGTLTAYRDENGVIHVTVEVGELPG